MLVGLLVQPFYRWVQSAIEFKEPASAGFLLGLEPGALNEAR